MVFASPMLRARDREENDGKRERSREEKHPFALFSFSRFSDSQ